MRWCCRYSDNNRYRSISGSCCRHCYFVRNRYLCLPVSSVTFLACPWPVIHLISASFVYAFWRHHVYPLDRTTFYVQCSLFSLCKRKRKWVKTL